MNGHVRLLLVSSICMAGFLGAFRTAMAYPPGCWKIDADADPTPVCSGCSSNSCADCSGGECTGYWKICFTQEPLTPVDKGFYKTTDLVSCYRVWVCKPGTDCITTNVCVLDPDLEAWSITFGSYDALLLKCP